MRYVVNRPKVVSEAFDGEVVAIHLERGNYFSLGGAAAPVWLAFERGCALEDVRRAAPADAPGAAAIGQLLADLVAEDLIRPARPGEAEEGPGLAPDDARQPVRFEKFTDMQDLIMLDPIHDVEAEAGWPHRPEAPAKLPSGP